MKSLVTIGMLVMALSFCNLLGQRNANVSNNNTPPPAASPRITSAENSNATTNQQPTPNSNLPPAPQTQRSGSDKTEARQPARPPAKNVQYKSKTVYNFEGE